jgi:transcription antitermination factor NusG
MATSNPQLDPKPMHSVTVVPSEASLVLKPKWYAVSVCPRHEKHVARQLEGVEVQHMLPVYRSVRRWQDRRKEVDMVLFPGYVFVSLFLTDRLRVLQLPGVVNFVTFQGQPAVVPDHEIQSISLGLAAGVDVRPHPYLQKGRRVRVVRGPLTDCEGVLVRRKDRFRIVVSVELLMRSVALEVDECDVVPC